MQGQQYGEQARDRVQRSRSAYEEVFGYYARWTWPKVTEEAQRFLAPIEDFGRDYAEEMRGIAEGAALPFEDILALNVRTEVMFAAKARHALAQMPRRAECTSFAVLPDANIDGHALIGQNWDWLLHAFDTVVVLEAKQEAKPNYVTVVEAGLLAKTGMNSAGIGLATNALVSDRDCGEPGVPYHVLLRAILDAETITGAICKLQANVRSSSANFLVASDEGVALDIEGTPGDFGSLRTLTPNRGAILHTNHLLAEHASVKDISLWAMPGSSVRLQRACRLLETAAELSPSTLQQLLADHADHPWSICCHADPKQVRLDQGATVASIVMDLNARHLWLADGQPCSVPYRELDYSDFLDKDTPNPSGEPHV
jgi:isopenicillin-N N-acyltransferase-like protein